MRHNDDLFALYVIHLFKSFADDERAVLIKSLPTDQQRVTVIVASLSDLLRIQWQVDIGDDFKRGPVVNSRCQGYKTNTQ